MRLGMIGLGKMGGNMARRLRRAGIEVAGFNRDTSATESLAAESGLIAAGSVEELLATLDAPR
ncbi:MAG: NAD(P)-binding domain-containing protein, partial [Woeseiaceae bacterium]